MRSNICFPNQQTAWLILAVIAVSFTGIFAIEITFARIPFFAHLFSAEIFYRALCVHVVFAMLVWLLVFAIFLWHHYLPSIKSKFDSLSIALGFISTILIASVGFIEWGQSYLNDYLPVIHHPVFWIGIVMFIISFVLAIIKFAPHASALFNKNTEGQLVFYSLVISVIMLLSAGISFFTTEPVDDLKLYFQRMFWVPGHIQQFLNTCILLLALHYLIRKSNPFHKEGMKNNVWLKLANGLLFLSIFPILGGFFVDPVLPSFKLVTVFAYGIGLGVPVLIHTVFLFREMKSGGFAANTFLLSIVLYYVGVFIAYGGMKSDLRVTAHYHGVVTALTVALMGLTYFSLKENRLLKFDKLARIQPAVFTLGMVILILCLFFAGHYGAPRKTFGFSWVVKDVVISYLNILAIGAALSIVGGLMYIFYCIASLVRIPAWVKTVSLVLLIAFAQFSFRMPDETRFLGKAVADIRVFDSKGATFFLSELIKKKSAILSPIYTKCPSTCSVITANLQKAINGVKGIGKDFQVITFSFDTSDTPADLQAFESRWNLEDCDWEVVSAKGNDAGKLLASIDFEIEWNDEYKQYDHPNVVIVITPMGKISRYVYGVMPETNDLRISLLEAKKEKSSLGFYEGLLLRCFIYDPVTKKYVVDRKFIVMVISGGLTITGMLFFVVKNIFVK